MSRRCEAPTSAMGRLWTGLGATIVAALGCVDGGDRLEQGVEAIALGSTPLAEPGLGEHFLVAARPDVSFAGGPGGWLAVWASTPWDNYPAVMAARVGTDGALLDRPAFTLTPQPDVPGYAGVGAALGDRWITINGSDSRLATVPATGVPVVTRLTQPGCPYLSCDAAGCLCYTWAGSARRLDGNGAPVGAAFTYGLTASGTTAVAVSATQWLAVFNSRHPDTGAVDLRISRVLRDGTLRDGQGVPFTTIAAGRTQPAVATDGTAYLVVFKATVGSGSRGPGLYAQRVEAATSIVAGPPVFLAAGTDFSNPSVAWDGARYWVAWERVVNGSGEYPGQYVRLGADGTLLDAAPRVLGSTASRVRRPRVAVSAGRVAMAWQEGDLGTVWFQRFRADGTGESAAAPISYQAQWWAQPSLASDGNRFALTCQVGQLAGASARAWLIGANGAVINPAGAGYAGPAPTSLFWDGARYRGFATNVVGSAPSLHVTLDAAGTTLATTPLPTPPSMGTYAPLPAQAALLGDVAILGTTYGGVAGFSRFNAAGMRIDPLPIAFGGSTLYASDGTVLLGVWAPEVTSLRAGRISRDGDLLDAVTWDLSYRLPGGSMETFRPSSLAAGGGVWSVLGTTSANPTDLSTYLRLRQANASGSLLRSIDFGVHASPSASVLWNGREFVVAAFTNPAAQRSGPWTLRVWSVRPDGVVSPPGGIVLDPDLPRASVSLAALSDGTTGVAWVQTDFRRATRRCVVRLLQPGMGVDAGAPVDTGTDTGNDAGSDRPDVAVVDAGADSSAPLDTGVADVPVVAADVPVAVDVLVAVDVPADAPDGGGVVDVLTPDLDAPTPDGGATDAGAPADVDAAVDVPPTVDIPGPTDRPATTDVPAAVDAGDPPPPEDGGGCDVGGVAGTGSRSPLFGSLSLLALVLASRRRGALNPR